MVAIAELQLDEVERETLAASLDAWRATGEDPAVTSWDELCPGFASRIGSGVGSGVGTRVGSGVAAVTVIPNARRIECLVREPADFEELGDVLRVLVAAQWTACLITSLRTLSRAHEELRGAPVYLQGWWRDSESAVHFTADQVP